MSPAHPKTAGVSAIGRFKVWKVLGKGSQGIVYLAEDPELGREVAIKTLLRSGASTAALVREARHASRLQHPHIATVFDIGEHENSPYVVYEYIEGRSLTQVLSQTAPLTLLQVVAWMGQMLDAMAYAHEEGIIHRDLKPDNIRIDNDGMVKVLDFGIATATGTQINPADAVLGTVNYMAPEQLSGGTLGPATDVFALGLILFEMLTGQRAITAGDAMAAMYAIAHEKLPTPSRINPLLEQCVDEVVLCALEKDPATRFSGASLMKQALDACAVDEPETEDGSRKSTLSFLLRRMRRKADFPAMSERISEIKRHTNQVEKASVSKLANVILKDYALTTKLLKLVNSSFYGQYGGRISTVSRAVVILGFKQVRMIAQSLLLFEHINNKPQAQQLKESASVSVLSGIIGRQLADDLKAEDPEEIFICSMVNNLGKYLVLFYLPEEYDDIEQMMAHKGVDESRACRNVLGITYDQIGIGVAKEWGLPDTIVESMRELPEGPAKECRGGIDLCQQIATFSNQLCRAITEEPADLEAIKTLQQRFEKTISLDEEQLISTVRQAMTEAKEYGPLLSSDMESTKIFRAAELWGKGESPQEPVAASQTEFERSSLIEDLSGNDDSVAVINGIQDITNALLENCSVNEILSMILETIFRGLGFTRVLLCIVDRRNGQMVSRHGLGRDADRIINQFRFPLNTVDDLFGEAIRGKEHLVFPKTGLSAANLPKWFTDILSPRIFILLPIVVNGACPAAIYCDLEEKSQQLSAKQFNYLNTLRKQAALALKQGR